MTVPKRNYSKWQEEEMTFYTVNTESKVVDLKANICLWCNCNTSSSVYKNASYRGHCVSLCNDTETNSGPSIPITSSLLTEYCAHE